MAAEWFKALADSARGRSTNRSHASLPVWRSKHWVNSLPPSKAVRKMWRHVRTGEDLPGRTVVLQRRFFCLLNSVGKPASCETPEPFGPRKRFHSSASAAETKRNNTIRRGHRFMVFVVRQRGRLKEPSERENQPAQYNITIPDGCIAKLMEDDVQSVLCKSASQ